MFEDIALDPPLCAVQLRDLVAELQGQLADAHQLLQTKSVQVLELELQLKKCGREALDKDHQIALLKAGAPKQVDPPVIENRAFHDTGVRRLAQFLHKDVQDLVRLSLAHIVCCAMLSPAFVEMLGMFRCKKCISLG